MNSILLSYLNRVCVLFIVCIAISSCNQSILSGKLDDSDSLVLDFADENQVLVKQIETTDKTAINKLAGYIGNKTFEKSRCSLGGRMIFYKSGTAIEQVEFNSSEGCRYFTFIYEGKLVSTEMSDEAASFLVSIQQGKTHY